MDRNRIEGAKHQAKGAAREMAGKITRNKKLEMLGAIENRFGKAQRLAGKSIDQKHEEEE